ncbi:zinc finger MYND domain-containing protein 11-like isoform X2 [Babylonia areolata]|uniref:zinc finger MYND domain-containing protein 11-like isoform X2 n=1 Tax=Babylonia areolata TaxID=304850 RepID=UPI003FD1B486
MVRPVKRRQATVAQTKQLLEAVIYIRQQKQIPNVERISKYMQREHSMGHAECRRHLNSVVNDGFIVEYTAVGFKGQRTGLEQEGYKIPTPDEENIMKDDHDWYCFTCHRPGELLLCSECFRTYHTQCTEEDHSGSKFTCSICKAGKKKNKMKKKMLNTLLSYTILRLREKTKELHKIGTKSEEDLLRQFVYQRMDLNAMEIKVQASRYKCLEEFYADAQTIHHNCVLLYGDTPGGMTELANIMLKDCKYDLDEIELCPNCYYMSNAKPDQWFCQPCNPPHDLVYAKMKGFGYWPAKVINEVDGKMDVRFFGGWHQRAVIPAEYIRPVTTSLSTLPIKRTVGFTKACKELSVHQQLLEEREREFQDLSAKEGFEEEEEELERKEEQQQDEDVEKAPRKWGGEEEEVDTRQVTSTSVDTKRKRKSSSVKAAPADEAFVVTSSEDKVTHPPASSSKVVVKAPVTVSTHSQTMKTKTHVVGTQTVKSDTQEDKDDDDDDEEEEVPVKKMPRLSPPHRTSEAEVQARLDKAAADLTEHLKKQHEEDKIKSLKELTDRLKKDFEEDLFMQ